MKICCSWNRSVDTERCRLICSGHPFGALDFRAGENLWNLDDKRKIHAAIYSTETRQCETSERYLSEGRTLGTWGACVISRRKDRAISEVDANWYKIVPFPLVSMFRICRKMVFRDSSANLRNYHYNFSKGLFNWNNTQENSHLPYEQKLSWSRASTKSPFFWKLTLLYISCTVQCK